jgi:osmotically inducible protein OsmC
MKRTAKAHWSGNLKEGRGTLTTESAVLNGTKYSFRTRFEEGEKGTNPEELLAAAHAGCFTMAVASFLTKQGVSPESLDTEATVTMEGGVITEVRLAITGSVTGMNAEAFAAVAKEAEKECPISKALRIPVRSEAHLI